MNLDIAGGQCMNSSVPQNVTFDEQGGILDNGGVVVGHVQYTAAVVCAVVAFNDVRSWLLAGLMLAAALTLFWSFGAFRRDVWFGSPETDAQCAEIDAALDAAAEYEARREERHRRTTTH